MAPITALLNSNVSDDKGIQVFYVTDQDNLAVSLKNSSKNGQGSENVFASGKDSHAGLISVKSEIATAVLDGLNIVVGVTKHKLSSPTETPTVNDVSISS
ncbi:hypothetical protein FGADI_11407 [Fusarium gaditjirri]|uniref:Uncharacterized protein n=1 Tax=Fusarium gaditjirri TaxID=282569 RepID=A0A8H4WQJ3_9HYPO|nr:hypothetical protein FGADI_11407 [Fusarium gaditjirri]